jgi:hypothetical protein
MSMLTASVAARCGVRFYAVQILSAFLLLRSYGIMPGEGAVLHGAVTLGAQSFLINHKKRTARFRPSRFLGA